LTARRLRFNVHGEARAVHPNPGDSLPVASPPKNGKRREEAPMKQADILVLDFVNWGFDNRGWAKKTRTNYKLRVRAAEEWLKANTNRSLFAAHSRDLRAYLFSTTPNAGNRNHIRQALMAYFDFLVDREYRDDNPARGLPRLPTTKTLPRVLDVQQARLVLRAAKAIGPREEALVAVLLYTGIRRGEVGSLLWDSIDEEWIKFEATKSRRERQIPLHPNAALALRKWRGHCKSSVYVFASTRNPNRPMSDGHLNQIVRDVGELAGVHLHPHLCRHTCATTLLAAGVDLRTVQEWLGHASPTTTARYTHIRPAMLKEAGDKLSYD
jgi:site-specific recombinase XerD